MGFILSSLPTLFIYMRHLILSAIGRFVGGHVVIIVDARLLGSQLCDAENYFVATHSGDGHNNLGTPSDLSLNKRVQFFAREAAKPSARLISVRF